MSDTFSPAAFGLTAFAQQLFDSMIDAANMGITPPMTFLLRCGGETAMEVLPDFAGGLLSHGRAKDMIFQYWRNRCKDPEVEAFACGSEMWGLKLNRKGASLQEAFPERYRAMIDHGFTKIVAAGLGKRCEVFQVTAQTRERVVIVQRRFTRSMAKLKWDGPAEGPGEFSQENFGGRQKMWGDLRPENLS